MVSMAHAARRRGDQSAELSRAWVSYLMGMLFVSSNLLALVDIMKSTNWTLYLKFIILNLKISKTTLYVYGHIYSIVIQVMSY